MTSISWTDLEKAAAGPYSIFKVIHGHYNPVDHWYFDCGMLLLDWTTGTATVHHIQVSVHELARLASVWECAQASWLRRAGFQYDATYSLCSTLPATVDAESVCCTMQTMRRALMRARA